MLLTHLVAKRDSSDKFNKGLPSKDKFCNSFTKRKISNRTYEHYVNVLKTFRIRDMKNYCDLYLKVDVLLLPDVFDTITRESINFFKIPSSLLSIYS